MERTCTANMMILPTVLLVALAGFAQGAINRRSVVSRYNPTRNASSLETPMQVGNGNFAFGADVTGLQTFQPFAIMASWGWKNDSLPEGKTMEDVENYQGVKWDNHGLLVEYDFGGDAAISDWLRQNPNRVNLGRVGLLFRSQSGELLNVTESNLTGISQELDLWTGTIKSCFSFDGVPITVETTSAQTEDSVGISVTSSLLHKGRLGVFLDFPWNDGLAKFSAPFVGSFNTTSNHTTSLSTKRSGNIQAEITHTLNTTTFITSVRGDKFSVTRDSPDAHRYTIKPSSTSSHFALSVSYGKKSPKTILSPLAVSHSSTTAWKNFWTRSGFIDVFTGSKDSRANELQRRIILSRYLMRVNEAGDTPPQEVSFDPSFYSR